MKNPRMNTKKNVMKEPGVNKTMMAAVNKRPSADINRKRPMVLGCVKCRGMSCNTCRNLQFGRKRLSRESWLKLGLK